MNGELARETDHEMAALEAVNELREAHSAYVAMQVLLEEPLAQPSADRLMHGALLRELNGSFKSKIQRAEKALNLLRIQGKAPAC